MQQLLGALNEQINLTQVIVTFALIMARVMSIVLLVPFLGGKNAPTEVKMGIGVTLTMIIWPTALSNLSGPIPLTPIGFLLMMMKETKI
jgi:flagellar biosynthetic protein FliR